MEEDAFNKMKDKIWAAVRKVQADGARVGPGAAYIRRSSTSGLCILGAVLAAAGRSPRMMGQTVDVEDVHRLASEELGITVDQARSLETGFEFFRHRAIEDLQLYRLGREAARQLRVAKAGATT